MEIRAKYLLIRHDQILAVLSGKLRFTNLPEDARLLNVSWAYEYNAFAVAVTSDGFPVVEPGQALPIMVDAEISYTPSQEA